MNRLKILWLCTVILGGSAAAQIRVSVPRNPELADLVARVQDTRASQLDKDLPDVSLSDWLLAQAGPDAKVAWAYRPPIVWDDIADPYYGCAFVSADATTWDGRSFFVSIATDGACSVPTFDSGIVVSSKKGGTSIHRLSELPRLLWKNPNKYHRTEAMR
jgi:hypothetical protein